LVLKGIEYSAFSSCILPFNFSVSAQDRNVTQRAK
jgi:hypothetical protein